MTAKTKMIKAGRIMLKLIMVIAAILLICISYLLIKSPGKLPSLTDEQGKAIPNSISERNKIEIGGIRQGFFIRSENPENPVILFLHGGPGNPELPFIIQRETGERLEKYFTVCYWEQRGAGMSYNKSIDPATMGIERMTEDAHEMTAYLKQRFKKDQIYLIGHSWGSCLGIKTIEKYPADYLAYIGISQITDQFQSELLAYDYILKHATKIDDKKTIRKLDKSGVDTHDFINSDYWIYEGSKIMDKYGIGTMHKNFSMTDFVMDVLLFEGYTINDKIRNINGSLFSMKHLFPYVLSDNLFETSKSFEVPIFILHGKHDYQVSYTLSERYLKSIEAPQKAFFSFENSAHSPNMEEPEKFVQIMRDIDTQISAININILQ